MEIIENKSRANGKLYCSACNRIISIEEFNANKGYCDECRDDRGNKVVQFVKDGAFDAAGRDEELLRRIGE